MAFLSSSIFGVGSGCGIGKPADAIAVPVHERARVDLVDDAALPPMVEMGNGSFLRRAVIYHWKRGQAFLVSVINAGTASVSPADQTR